MCCTYDIFSEMDAYSDHCFYEIPNRPSHFEIASPITNDFTLHRKQPIYSKQNNYKFSTLSPKIYFLSLSLSLSVLPLGT